MLGATDWRDPERIDLKGRVVLVTGGFGRLAVAIVRAVARSGGLAAVHDDTIDGAGSVLQRAIGPDLCRAVAGPSGGEPVPASIFARARAWRGRIDVLVNCGGIALAREPAHASLLGRAGEDVTSGFVPLSLRGFSIAAASHFRSRPRGGIIINLAASATVSGVRALTRKVARNYAEAGVTAFVALPGAVTTMFRGRSETALEEPNASLPENGLADPASVARTVVRLASRQVGPSRASDGDEVMIRHAV